MGIQSQILVSFRWVRRTVFSPEAGEQRSPLCTHERMALTVRDGEEDFTADGDASQSTEDCSDGVLVVEVVTPESSQTILDYSSVQSSCHQIQF